MKTGDIATVKTGGGHAFEGHAVTVDTLVPFGKAYVIDAGNGHRFMVDISWLAAPTIYATKGLSRENLYRFNEVKGYWEFYDGVGPWTPSAMLEWMNEEQGKIALLNMNFEPQP